MLDASAALAFSLPSQANPAVDAFFARTPLPSLRAPGVFRIEARNALLRFERIGAIVAAHADAAWSLIAAMVTLAPLGEIDAGFDGVIALARAERLSFFDACDLDMAIREAASLASLAACRVHRQIMLAACRVRVAGMGLVGLRPPSG